MSQTNCEKGIALTWDNIVASARELLGPAALVYASCGATFADIPRVSVCGYVIDQYRLEAVADKGLCWVLVPQQNLRNDVQQWMH